ncbi:purine-nucleoside phosphorylase [Patescibacteria group bacterium]|nr:MAG: purine-nucleoside phosphorylase [Patescibacteria group bacterium]
MIRNANEERVHTSAVRVKTWLGTGFRPQVAVVLGSGLGSYATGSARSISYDELGLPSPGVEGHAGRLFVKEVGERCALLLAGRVHAYEGHAFEDVVFAVRTLAMAGVDTFVVTCAAGSVNTDYRPGDLVILRDHLNLASASPLRGENVEAFGPRFPDMTDAYDPEYRELAQDAAREVFGKPLAQGIYAMMAGPQYETPAEVRMLRALGADLAGMSTVPEVIALRHMNRRVLGLSCVTNYGAGVKDQPLSHNDVVGTAAAASRRFTQLLTAIIARLPKT